MKFPLFAMRSYVSRVFVILTVTMALAVVTFAQKGGGGLIPENDSATLQQCRNGNPPVPCTGRAWVTGNAGASNSHWNERDFIAYRMIFGGLTAGTVNTVVIGYDILDNGKHAIDYLGSYNQTETTADPCSDVLTAGVCASPLTAPIPTDPDIPGTIPQIPGVFTFWGATFDIDPVTAGVQTDITRVACPTNDDIRQCIQIRFIPSGADAVLAWGGHIAWRGEWGAGQSAGGISGSPYHMRLIDLNGQGGNQDRSLSANAVNGPASLKIIKAVTTFGGGTTSTVQFFFDATAGAFDANRFFLVDDNADPGVDFKLSNSYLLAAGQTQVITVSEDTSVFPFGQNWSLGFISCTENVSTVGTTINNGLARVTVTLDPEEVAVCTFNNTQLSPSAAPASVSGRAVDAFGNGIGGALITVMDAQNGATWTAITNPFGYYTIDGLEVGQFYAMTISHKRYQFADDTRTFTIEDNITGLDWVANP